MNNKFSPSHGFTVIELLVSMLIGLMIIAMVLDASQGNRDLYKHDIIKTRLNQDLRSSIDIIGVNIREAGENLPPTFPAVLITNGASGAPDTLTLRRNLLDEVVNVCTAIAAGSTTTTITFGTSGTVQGCTYSSNTTTYNNWRTYRLAQSPTQATVYVYDSGAKVGEFITYTGETDSGTTLSLTKSAGTWQYAYPVGTSAAYMIEEWKFSLPSTGELQLVANNDTANPMKVAFGLTDFQVNALMQDTTTKTSFTTTDNWTLLQSLQVTLNSSTTFRKRTVASSLTGEFFPRNVLSN